MTGLHDTDIRLTNDGGLTRAADGDAPICSDYDCIYQNIVLEAQTQPGDLFYDQSFGWGLYDFIQSEDDELVRIELTQRARVGLQKREVILPETVRISLDHDEDVFRLRCSFRFDGEDADRKLDAVVGAVSVEAITYD